MARVTVLMAVYNGMPFLPEAVNSIIGQTLSEWKFVIVNDGSTDESAAWLSDLEDSRVQIIHQENQGLAASLNNGLQAIDTEFVARLDSDDIALPHRLERQLEIMNADPAIGLLGSQFERLGEQESGFPSKLPCEHDDIVDALLNARHALCHPTIMMRTDTIKSIGGYWEHPIAQDWDMYLKMGEHSRLANLDEVLVKYRIHTGSLNGQKLASIRRLQRYAADCSRRRMETESLIEFDEFVKQEESRSLWWRFNERMKVTAMHRYRQALSSILGGHRVRGYAQMALAAASSPELTTRRISRILTYNHKAEAPQGTHTQAQVASRSDGG